LHALIRSDFRRYLKSISDDGQAGTDIEAADIEAAGVEASTAGSGVYNARYNARYNLSTTSCSHYLYILPIFHTKDRFSQERKWYTSEEYWRIC
jgi:hypothetical protein